MVQVKKRNHAIVQFDKEKISRAIINAMLETTEGKDVSLAASIAEDIQEDIQNYVTPITVEEIQDMIEDLLMESKRKDVAKRYIIHRNERSKVRNTNKKIENRILTDEFISKYKHRPSPMKQLGDFVYHRTYSRWLPEQKRREYWWETVRRAVEYNCNLVPTTREEAEKLFDNIYNLKQFLSGRTFWVGGTDVAKSYPMANFNCSFQIIEDFDSFKDLFYLLMIGSGVGIRILKEDIEQMPKIRTDFEVFHKVYSPIKKGEREDNTSLKFLHNNTVKIVIGDSKEGWTQSLDFFFKIFYSNEYRDIKTIIVDYDYVRPKGEKLKTFGGTASGHSSLQNMFIKIDKTIKKIGATNNTKKVKLKPIDCLDIANIIGENVVVGGVRRTAEIVLLDTDDKESIEAKSGLYKQIDGQWIVDKDIIHRQMSNNSIYYKKKPTREKLHWQIEKMRYSGEPGWVNEEAGAKRRPNMNGVNPCFTGDMKLLTAEGYKTFKELSSKEVEIININGNKSIGKVWSNGIKDTIKLTLSNNNIITCTPDHKFMTIEGEECEAQHLKDKKIMHFNKEDAVVVKIESNGAKEVFDFNEPITHWGVVEGYIAHNCGEILLDSKGLCNLTTINVHAFANSKDKTLNLEGLKEAQRLSARAGYRMTCVELELPKWNVVQQRDKLIGCSLTGWQDMVNAIELTKEEEGNVLRILRDVANEEAKKYANEIGENEPLLVTTVKPEGTLSQLPTVSSGIHYSHSPYYIRRIRINAHDPLVKVCEELNYPIFPEVGQILETCTTKVIEFPVKSPIGRTKYDVSAIEQLENYKMFMENYVDHNASITVHVRNHEWDEVEQWVWDNWDDVVALSFLSLDDNFYELLPYESIEEEEYNRRVEEMKPFIPSLLSKYEKQEVELDIGNESCESGVCPIR